MNRILCATLILATSLSASAADKRIVTWIGGDLGSLFTAKNWDPELEFPDTDKNWSDWARITNSVTFTENDATYFWRNSRLSISGNSTVTFNARFWTATEKYLTADKEMFVDIEEGSTFVSTYLIGGNSDHTFTFVKTGGGKIVGDRIGSLGNLFNKIRIQEGTAELRGNRANPPLRAKTSIEIGSEARVLLINENAIAVDDGCALLKVDGLLDINSKAQIIDGLCGSGVITNAAGGITLQMRAQGQNEFSGKIFGALKVAPTETAPVDSCLVIASADSLMHADVTVVPTADNPQPLKFKPGIGVFYMRTIPSGYEPVDTDGNPVELRISALITARHLYVSCEKTDDTGDGLSPESAYRTIKAALTSPNLAPAPELNIVHVAKGVYNEGEMGSADDFSRAEVPANVWLVADDKSEGATIIVGKPADDSSSSLRGCGSGAVRCVKLASGARIEGFTLTGGRTATQSGTFGGGVDCADYASYIVDCVISNNVAVRGGGGHKGTYIRTKILSNYATTDLGSGLYLGCYLYNCLFDDNGGIGFYSAGERSLMVNCLFAPQGTSIRADGTDEGKRTDAYNTIFMSDILLNPNDTNNTKKKMRLHNCLTMAVVPSNVEIDEDCTVTNGFSSAAEKLAWLGLDENYRPTKALPGVLVNGGNNAMYSLPVNENLKIDLAGALRISGGTIDLGPYEADFARTLVIFEDNDDGITVEGIDAGITEITQGESVSVTLKRTFESERLCIGFTVNGEFVDFDDYPNGWTREVEGLGLSHSLAINAVYAEENKIFYVDAENGDDANRGYHIACPKKTLAAAFTPAPAAGTIVYAAPGYYTNETIRTVGGNLGEQHYRVVIPNGVSLISLEGAKRTFIGGESSGDHGAVACVKMLNNTSLLRGFTCFGGRTNTGFSGAGAIGPGTVEDCVFDDCRAAHRGGGAYMATAVRRCRFYNCGAGDLGSAINECLNVYNCVFDACTNGNFVTSYSKPIVNSVFLPSCGSKIVAFYKDGHGTYPFSVSNLMNCAVFCKPFNDGPVYTRCAFASDTGISDAHLGEGSIVLDANLENVLSVAKMAEDGTLQAGSPLIDAGSNLLYTATGGEVDHAKRQRIYNGTIDIGAFEYDCRGEFARALSQSRRFTVVEASSDVTKDVAGGIAFSDGDTVSIEWSWPNGSVRDVTFELSVSGEGVFSYSLSGGEPVAVDCTGGKTEVVLKGIPTPMSLKLEFSGSGTALVSSFKRSDIGMKLILR